MLVPLRRAFAIWICAMVPLGCAGGETDAEMGRPGRGVAHHVALPSGEVGLDRAAVQAALDSARSGDTVFFGAGRYLLGAGATLRVPGVTLVGHPGGTVLRGCEPEAFDIAPAELASLVMGCTGLFVQAERQTIRNITFEYAWHGIVVGPYPATVEELLATQGVMPPTPAGGHRIEGNTFRSTPNGIRMLGVGEAVSVVSDNDFVDVFHAIGIYGPPVQFVGNRITVTDPAMVPTSRHPGSAILVSSGHTDCTGHVIAENAVEGYPGAIYVLAAPGQTCRGVEIRGNVLRVVRVNVPAGTWVIPTSGDSSMVDVPITLSSQPGGSGDLADGAVEGILVQGNRILGADGIGILVNGSRNRILDNTVSDIRRRDPFPGVTWDPALVTWAAGNGSGIWVGPAARDNEITGNRFARIAGPSITVEGSGNRVTVSGDGDTVSDFGGRNRVTRR